MDAVKPIDCGYVEDHDLVKSYLGGTLSEEEAEAFEAHYFACDRCWEEVNAANQIRASMERGQHATGGIRPARVRRGPWTRPVLLALAAGIALVVAAGIIVFRSRGGTSPISVVETALGEHRPIEPRIAGFGYRPLAPITRGSPGAQEEDLLAAAAYARKQVEEHPSTDTWRALGLAQLLLQQFDRAIDSLERAGSLDGGDPSLSSDLSAAFLARAQQKLAAGDVASATADLNSALKKSKAALQIVPAPAEALFNHALALEIAGLRNEAVGAWRRYLEKDSSSHWAAEARSHIAGLSEEPNTRLWEKEQPGLEAAALSGNPVKIREILSRFQQPLRLLAEDTVLPEWAEAAISGDVETADRRLRFASAVSRALENRGDFLIADSIEVLSRARGTTLETLKRGHRAFGRARESYKRRGIRDAIKLFQEAQIDLAETPFRSLATLGLASCAYIESDLDRCTRLLDELQWVMKEDAPRYLSLAGQAHWVRGLVQESRGQLGESLDSYEVALEAFERLRETGNIATLHMLLAEDLRYLGERNRAWVHRREAILLLGRLGPSSKLPPALGEASRAALRENHLDLARAYGDEQLTAATEIRDDVLIAEAFYERSLIQHAEGNLAGARLDFQRARDSCARISEESVRSRMLANIRASEGEVAADENPDAAIEAFTDALDFFRKSQHHFRVAELLLRRGRLHAARQETSIALQDFLGGIDELEAQREVVSDEGLRISHFETAASLFDEAIGMLSRRHDLVGAFDYTERERARSLLDATGRLAETSGSPIRAPLSWAQLSAHIPDHVALLEYAVLEDRLLLWIAKRDGIRSVEVPVSRARLDQLVRRIRGSTHRAAAADLYSVLITPSQDSLQTVDTLVFVPDGILHSIPFAALVDAQGEYLVHRFRIGISPSATLYVNSLERERQLVVGSPPSVLAVGNPTIDAKRFPNLPELTASGREAFQIASYYPQSETLTAGQATPRRFLELVPRFDVIHFAGHAVTDPHTPALSALILAADSESGDNGTLYADRILEGRLEGISLVVLAACSTAEGHTLGTEGVLSLARTFLAAGVPAVVASLGDVVDTNAAALFTVFHQRLRAGSDAMTALQAAQLSLIEKRETRNAPSWALFEVFGGVRPRKGNLQ